MTKRVIEALVDGGKATPSPPLGPSLAAYKVNIGKIIQDINEKTKDYEGMKVPVKIIIDDETKEHEIKVGIPPVSSLIRKELGLEKIAAEKEEKEGMIEEGEEKEEISEMELKKLKPWEREKLKREMKEKEEEEKEVEKEEPEEEEKEREIVGDLTIDQCIKITKMKRDSLLAKDMQSALKEVVASCVSMPVTVEGKNPKEILKDIDEGKYDSKF